jgi:hypothetical protein
MPYKPRQDAEILMWDSGLTAFRLFDSPERTIPVWVRRAACKWEFLGFYYFGGVVRGDIEAGELWDLRENGVFDGRGRRVDPADKVEAYRVPWFLVSFKYSHWLDGDGERGARLLAAAKTHR